MTEFSIISVYNDRNTLSEFLISGLNQQHYSDFEKVFVDNRDQEYNSAAAALNKGAERSNGNYYVFVHQDVKLPPEYLCRAKEYLEDLDNLGIAGAAGVREVGKCRSEGVNIIKHGEDRRDWERGNKIVEPTEANSLDELLLIVPCEIFDSEPFSTDICRGWHLYGVEYAMRMKRKGKSVKVLPISLWHRSDGGWRDWKHEITLFRLIQSYPNAYCIHTTGGSWPATKQHVFWRLVNHLGPIDLLTRFIYSWKENGPIETIQKVKRKLNNK